MGAATQFPINYGKSAPFPSQPAGGGNFTLTQNVQLISERVNRPRQWVITVMPVTLNRLGAQNLVPWIYGAEGAQTVPSLVQVNTVPFAAMNSIPYRIRLGWGAGGVRAETQFDYPVAGGTFALLADTIDLTVIDPTSASLVVPTLDNVPWFGAWMVPGQPASRSTMRFTDPVSANTTTGQSVFYSVKPYARTVYISQYVAASAGQNFEVRFLDAAGVGLWQSLQVQDGRSSPQPIPVPSGAVFMEIINLATAAPGLTFRPMWDIELS